MRAELLVQAWLQVALEEGMDLELVAAAMGGVGVDGVYAALRGSLVVDHALTELGVGALLVLRVPGEASLRVRRASRKID